MLVDNIAALLRSRNARLTLDCAAGTGFPSLDLKSHHRYEVHCTDASEDMLSVLIANAKARGVDPSDLTPDRGRATGAALEGLRLDWNDLHQIPPVYDYVMCRGNSLVYANTWSGGDQVVDKEIIAHYLEQMAGRLRPGGFLHVDAPWNLTLPPTRYRPLSYGETSVWEEVAIKPGRRRWRVVYRPEDGMTTKFERFSTLLTVHDLADMLGKLGFDQTTPFTLDGERPSLGVIVARKRHGPRALRR